MILVCVLRTQVEVALLNWKCLPAVSGGSLRPPAAGSAAADIQKYFLHPTLEFQDYNLYPCKSPGYFLCIKTKVEPP